MSTLYRRGAVYYVGVPTHPTGWKKRSTGTHAPGLAASMARMMDDLGPTGRRAWHFLDAVNDGRLAVATLHDAWIAGAAALEALGAELNDVDAQEAIPGWLKFLRDHVAPDTIQHYGTHVRTFIPKDARFPVSKIGRVELSRWLNSLECSSSTKRKYRAAMSSFCNYLMGMGLLAANPVLQVKPPKAGAARMRYLDNSQVVQLVEAQPEPFRTISALMHATGMEISAVLRVTRGDLDTKEWMVRAHGTKTASRDRQAYVLEWARPYLSRHVAALLPGALLFPNVTRWAPSVSHSKARKSLGIDDYSLRDSRHTFAVEMVKAGIPAEFIARQLGHADTQMVNKVYSRFAPSHAETWRVFERANERLKAADGV